MANRFYAVAKGKRPGVYTSWTGPEGAEVQVKGFRGARFKSFATREEALRWLQKAGVPIQEKPEGLPLPQDPETVIVFTDGSSRGNPGPGGWAMVRLSQKGREERSGGFRRTTNNRMELVACIEGLKDLGPWQKIFLYTDSQYVARALNEGWATRWRQKGWRLNGGKEAENTDLWVVLLDLLERLDVQIIWVPGHEGHPGNERCHHLATLAASRSDLPEDLGFKKREKTHGGRTTP